MPDPSVEPIPPLRLSRRAVPDDAQDASYFAASDSSASFSLIPIRAMRSYYVLRAPETSARPGIATRRRRQMSDSCENPVGVL